MSKNRPFNRQWTAALGLSATLACLPLSVHADEREDLEKLRATVLSLIDTLVKTGILPRDRADLMMREAQQRSEVQLAKAPAVEVGPDGKKIVRVPYVPEAVRTQMRDQIKAEVLAETRGAGGGGGAMLAEAGSRFQIEGDLRVRAEAIRPTDDNSPASVVSLGNPDVTRAPDLWANANANTQLDQGRTRLRARLGFNFAVSDSVTAGLTVSTGGTTGPTSTNQTMAQGASQTPGYFNKYSLVLDRAFVRYEPITGLSMTAGRMRNPFMATDLVWADDLNFEGFAMGWKAPGNTWMDSFVTAGWFPLSFSVPGAASDRSLLAIQAGASWQFGVKENRLKVAAALYDYTGISGIKETTTDKSTVPDYVVRSEYGSGYRQRGNTLFRINSSPLVDPATNWGLASGFRELDLTASLDIAQFDPLHVILSGDLVYNLEFDRNDIKRRTGLDVRDGSGVGYLARVQVGAPTIKRAGDWNVSLAYRRLGSDAVVDAFTNSDFGLGGTNNKGFLLGGNYGLARNTWLTARWLSSQAIDSLVPVVRTDSPNTKYSIDTIQVDFNTRF